MSNVSRRSFLKASAALVAVPLVMPRRVLGANERLRIAAIGVGGRGAANLNGVRNRADVVALCDVDANKRGAAGDQFPAAKRYRDYRVMMDHAADFDAIWEFQGADDDGTGLPAAGTFSTWVTNIDLIDGKEHVRFRVDLNATYLAPRIDDITLPWF